MKVLEVSELRGIFISKLNILVNIILVGQVVVNPLSVFIDVGSLAVSQVPVVRSEHVRTLFNSTQSQESKSEVLSISANCSQI